MTNTPALTAEQRAEKLFARLIDADARHWESAIASAIREAEDAAYERAAVIAEGFKSFSIGPLLLRSLKSQKETP